LIALGEEAGERLYAVVGASGTSGTPGKIAVRSTGSSEVRNTFLGKNFEVVDALGFKAPGGEQYILVTRRNTRGGWIDFAIVDPMTRTIIRTLHFNGQLQPDDVTTAIEPTGLPSSQVSVAGIDADDRKVRIETRGMDSSELLSNAWLTPTTPVQSLVYLGTESGVSVPSLAAVTQDNLDPFVYHVVIVDLLTGEKTRTLDFSF
jgi:hypothetical protein